VTGQDEMVRRARMRGYVSDDGRTFMAPADAGPMVASAAAELALGGAVRFVGIRLGCPAYERR